MPLLTRTLSLPTLTPSARRATGGSRGQDGTVQARRRRRKPRLITGLDIGTTKVCAIIGSVDEDGRITVLGMGAAPSRGVRRGAVININETVDAVMSAYGQAHELAHIHPREVYVGIAGDHISGVNLEGTTEIANPNAGVDRRDCMRARQRALKMILPNDVEILHTFTREYAVNERGGITDPIGQFGQRLQVKMHVVTGSVSAGNNIFRCVRKAGLRTSGVVLQSVASSLSVLTEREKELGVVLVDIGGGTSDIAIFQGGVLQSISEIAMGGDIITQDVAKMLRCSPHDAENLKKKFGHAVPLEVDIDERIELRAPTPGAKRVTHSRRDLAEIIEARVEEILLGVQKQIQRSGCADRIYAGVVLTGGTALLEGIGGVAERLLGYPCHIGRPQNMLGMSGVVSTPIYSTAVGLIRWAVQEGESAQREGWLVRKIKKFLDIYG
ncbi:cell division protein FtsA [bacterium]|nr:cell division protein FtsA [bacterium]